MNNNDNNNSSSNNGNRGKFSDRLKKIRINRLKKNKFILDDGSQQNIVKSGLRSISKVILVIPSVVYTSIKFQKKNVDFNNIHINKGNIKSVKSSVDKTNVDGIKNSIKENKRIKVERIKEIDVFSLKKMKEISFKKENDNKIKFDVQSTRAINAELRMQELQKEIINLIKKKLVNNINELEILQSELFVLNQFINDDIYLSECQQKIKEIKRLLSKVKALKEKYDYLKDDVDFEYMLEYSDDALINKILELKDLCSLDEIRYTVDNYKLLDEYKFLYLKIDKLQEDTSRIDEFKNNKANELKERDIDFERLKEDVYNIDLVNDSYDRFVSEQKIYLNDLEGKISQIDSYEKTTYKLKGFNRLLSNSFKYLGLLLVNPLKGLIPGIATQTLITKNIVSNLYSNLEWEEGKKMVYDAIDYSFSIQNAINNLDDTSSLLDSTLKEIIDLKCEYIEKFSKYEDDIYGYKDTIKKINKIENSLLGNKIKINLVKNRMREKEKQNNDKLKMLKKLNSSSNN